MNDEKQILQGRFRNENHRLILNIIYTASRISCSFNKLLKDYDLTQQQFNILRILRGQGEKSVCLNEIQEKMLDRMSNASRLVEKLRKKSLVTRREAKNDRRLVEVKISGKGLELLKTIDPVIETFEEHFCISDEKEAKRINNYLDKLNY